MAENNNRNQNQQSSGASYQPNQTDEKNKQTQNTSDERQQNQNPQDGNQWSNYRTREMSGENQESEEGNTAASDE